ncbi:MAG TPA: hypothetical protein VEB86_14005 [Chryseosolibacter sp.]|nr:hypothetical protein [Chryseosolibacter sp.]
MKRPFLFFLSIVLILSNQSTFAQDLTAEATNNTSCGGPNGSASASVAGATDGYTFEWHAGNDNTGPLIQVGATVSNLAAGIYTVEGFDESTNQSIGVAQVMVVDAITFPEVTIDASPNTACTVNLNGSLTAGVNGFSGDYSFQWYEGPSAEGAVISSGQTLEGVASGVYSVKVTNHISLCQVTASAQITESQVIPEAIVQSTSNTSCTVPKTGSLSVTEWLNRAPCFR